MTLSEVEALFAVIGAAGTIVVTIIGAVWKLSANSTKERISIDRLTELVSRLEKLVDGLNADQIAFKSATVVSLADHARRLDLLERKS
jgi:hypothetical protein